MTPRALATARHRFASPRCITIIVTKACQASTPCKGISSRCDLGPSSGMGVNNYWGGQCFGGYDSKAISSSMMKSFTARGQSGPSHDNVPKFNWTSSDSCAGLPHEGFPELWAFDWVTFDAPAEWP